MFVKSPPGAGSAAPRSPGSGGEPSPAPRSNPQVFNDPGREQNTFVGTAYLIYIYSIYIYIYIFIYIYIGNPEPQKSLVAQEPYCKRRAPPFCGVGYLIREP